MKRLEHMRYLVGRRRRTTKIGTMCSTLAKKVIPRVSPEFSHRWPWILRSPFPHPGDWDRFPLLSPEGEGDHAVRGTKWCTIPLLKHLRQWNNEIPPRVPRPGTAPLARLRGVLQLRAAGGNAIHLDALRGSTCGV